MSMSDCPKCWETPCRCGNEYRHLSAEELRRLIQALRIILKKKLSKRGG